MPTAGPSGRGDLLLDRRRPGARPAPGPPRPAGWGRARRTRRRRGGPRCRRCGSSGACDMRHLHQHAVAGLVAVRVVDALEAVDVEQQHRERQLVALEDAEQLADLLLEVAQVVEAGERVGVGQRLELAGAGHHELLGRGGLDRAGHLGQPLDGVGEDLGVDRVELLAQRRMITAWSAAMSRARSAAERSLPARSSASAAARSYCSGVELAGVAVAVGHRAQDVADQERQLARDAVGGQRRRSPRATSARSGARARPWRARPATCRGARVGP